MCFLGHGVSTTPLEPLTNTLGGGGVGGGFLEGVVLFNPDLWSEKKVQ